MAQRRVAAPSPATQAGRSTAQALKKLPLAILWSGLVFALIGALIGLTLGFIGNLFRDVSGDVGPGFWFLFKLGFALGLGGIVVLYLRLTGFEDVQEGGRAFYASVAITLGAGTVLGLLLPEFAGHSTLQAVFMAGVAVVAIGAIANIFMKHEHKGIVGWGGLLAGVALIGLFWVSDKSGSPGITINVGTRKETPSTVYLHAGAAKMEFQNDSRSRSNRFEASARGRIGFEWKLDDDSTCGIVIINDRYRLQRCPQQTDIKSLRDEGILGDYEELHSVQFEGVGMKGEVITSWRPRKA